jgi:hypothetical protein
MCTHTLVIYSVVTSHNGLATTVHGEKGVSGVGSPVCLIYFTLIMDRREGGERGLWSASSTLR